MDDVVEYGVACVFSYLAIVDLFQSAVSCWKWARASTRLEAWNSCTITAESDSTEDFGIQNNICTMGKATVWCLMKKLRFTAERHDLSIIPARSPIQLQRMEISLTKEVYWCLQYNTDDFGWFQHASTITCGFRVWAPTLVMCRYFTGRGRAEISNRSCLEIGSGLGLLSMVLSTACGVRAVTTDINSHCLRVAEMNARMNGTNGMKFARLAYGFEDVFEFQANHGLFDVIVGADIVYSDHVIVPIFETVEALLAKGGSFFLGFVPRKPARADLLRTISHSRGFDCSSSVLADDSEERPPQKEKALHPGMEGMLYSLQEMLRSMPSPSSYVRENQDLVELYVFRREADFVPVHLDALD